MILRCVLFVVILCCIFYLVILESPRADRMCHKPNVAHAYVPGNGPWEVGARVKFGCRYGFSLCKMTSDNSITCTESGRWSEPKCRCLRNVWNPTRNPAIIKLNCPAENGSVIHIEGRFTDNGKELATILSNLKGNFGAISFSYVVEMGNSTLGDILLRVKPRGMEWRTVKLMPDVFPVKEDMFHIKYKILQQRIQVEVNGKQLFRYNLKEKVSVQIVPVTGSIDIEAVEVTYPRGYY